MRQVIYYGKAWPIFLLALLVSFERVSLGALGGAVSQISMPQVLVLIFGVVAFFRILAGQSLAKLPKSIFFSIGCYLFFEFFSQIYNDPAGVLALFRSRMVLLLMIVVFVVFSSDNEKDVSLLLKGFVFGAIVLQVSIILSAFGIINNQMGTQLDHRYFGSGLYRYRSSGLLLNYGDVSIVLSVASVAAYELIKRRASLFLSLTFFVLLPLAILGAESRNAFLAVSVAILTSLIFDIRKVVRVSFQKVILVFFSIAGLLVVIFWAEINAIFVQQLQLRGGEDPRISQYLGAFAAFYNSPLLGVGPGGFKSYALMAEGSVEVAVHNTFLQALVRAGLGGFFLIFAFLYMGWLLLQKSIKDSASAYLFAMFVGWLFAIQFYPALSYGSPIVWFPFCFFLSSLRLGGFGKYEKVAVNYR